MAAKLRYGRQVYLILLVLPLGYVSTGDPLNVSRIEGTTIVATAGEAATAEPDRACHYSNDFQLLAAGLQLLNILNCDFNHRNISAVQAIREFAVDKMEIYHKISALTLVNCSNLSPLDLVQAITQHPVLSIKLACGLNDALGDIFSTNCDTQPTETLDLSYNNLTKLESNQFCGLSSLFSLSLSSNSLTEVNGDALTNLRGLVKLSLKANQLQNLNRDVFQTLENIEEIDISNNQLLGVTSYAFEQNKKLKILNLDNNQISSIGKHAFAGLSALKQLELQHNQLLALDEDTFESLTSLEYLILSFNKLQSLPKMIFRDLVSLVALDMAHNELASLNPDLFHSLGNLQTLVLSVNRITEVDDNLFSRLHNLSTLAFSHNQLRAVSAKTFRNLTRIVSIHLDYNNLTNLPVGMVTDKYHLQHFNASYNQLSMLSAAVFENVSAVEDIGFRNNSITSIHPKFVIGAPEMAEIDLCNNQVTNLSGVYLNSSALYQRNNLSHSLDINMWNNPIECSCMSKSLYGRVKVALDGYVATLTNLTSGSVSADRVDISLNLKLSGIQVCHHASANYSILNNPVVMTDCDYFHARNGFDPHSPLFIVPTALAALLFITIIISVVIVVKVPSVRNHIHHVYVTKIRPSSWRQGGGDDADPSSYEYDAFISYDHKDMEFVMDVVHYLEGRAPPYKLCLHERDWQPGEYITDNIITSINQSQNSVFMLSRHFLASEWCQWEFRVAMRNLVEGGKQGVIVVRMGDASHVHAGKIDVELEYYLKTYTYLDHAHPRFYDKLCDALCKPQSALKKENVEEKRKSAQSLDSGIESPDIGFSMKRLSSVMSWFGKKDGGGGGSTKSPHIYTNDVVIDELVKESPSFKLDMGLGRAH